MRTDIVDDVNNFVDVAVEELAAADGMQKTMGADISCGPTSRSSRATETESQSLSRPKHFDKSLDDVLRGRTSEYMDRQYLRVREGRRRGSPPPLSDSEVRRLSSPCFRVRRPKSGLAAGTEGQSAARNSSAPAAADDAEIAHLGRGAGHVGRLETKKLGESDEERQRERRELLHCAFEEMLVATGQDTSFHSSDEELPVATGPPFHTGGHQRTPAKTGPGGPLLERFGGTVGGRVDVVVDGLDVLAAQVAGVEQLPELPLGLLSESDVGGVVGRGAMIGPCSGWRRRRSKNKKAEGAEEDDKGCFAAAPTEQAGPQTKRKG